MAQNSPPVFDSAELEDVTDKFRAPAFDDADLEDVTANFQPPAFDDPELEDVAADASFLDKIAPFSPGGDIRPLVRGTGRVVESIGGLVSMLPETSGFGIAVPEPVKKVYQGIGGFVTGLGEKLRGTVSERETGTWEPSNPKFWAEALPEVIPQLASQFAVAWATKGSSIPAQLAAFSATGGAQMAGQTYNDALKDRLDRGENEQSARREAAGEAALVGAIGSALERIPAAEYLTKGPVGKLVGQWIRGKTGNAIVRGGTEGFVEEMQELTNLASEAYVRGKEHTPEEIKARLFAAPALGFGAGSAASIAIDSASTPLTAAAVRETTTETGGGDNLNERSTTRIDNQSPLQRADANRDEPTGPDEGQYGGSQGQQAPGDYAPGNLQARGQGTPGPAGVREAGDVTSTPEPSPLASATEPMGAAGEVPVIDEIHLHPAIPKLADIGRKLWMVNRYKDSWKNQGGPLERIAKGTATPKMEEDSTLALGLIAFKDDLKKGKWDSALSFKTQEMLEGITGEEALSSNEARDIIGDKQEFIQMVEQLESEWNDVTPRPSAPSIGTSQTREGTAATPTGEVEAGAGVVPSQAQTTAFPGKRKEQYSVPYEQLDPNEKLARDLFDGVGKVEPLSPELEAKVDKAEEIAGEKIRLRPKEGGGIGTGGGLIPTFGTTPSGGPPLRIPHALKRAATGALFQEGSADLLEKLDNPVAQELATGIRKHVDQEQVEFARASVPMDKSVEGMGKARQNKAFDELEKYTRAKENGRPTPAISKDAQKILTAWEDVAELTGKEIDASGLLLSDPTTGGYRKPILFGRGYVPRMFSNEVEQVFRDRTKNPTLWNNLVRALAAHKGITEDAAANEMNAKVSEFKKNDHFANIEMARREQLPEIFYEYDLRNLIARYIPRYAERIAQIKAYGQRLIGNGGMVIQPNLFDKARAETQDDYSQEYLNDLENQAINKKAVGLWSRNIARLGAIANATLLSSPTTTVPRNLMSGTAATGELFGVERAAKGMIEAAKPGSGAAAREMGVIRSNMAEMLFADQLGEYPIDNVIRTVQNKALTWSGYTGSELIVRRHAAMTAAQFAKDAAAELAASPTSGLAKEAKRMFRRMKVDPAKISREGGDWKTGPETQRFIRATVRDTQGGYRFDQVPLWANSQAGRLFYQYGRYTVQRGRNIWKNGVLPALNGDPRALIRMGISGILLGEAFALLAKGLFDRDRKDASLKEIAKKWETDKLKATLMGMERMVNDLLMAGTMGMIGQPIDFVKSLTTKTRFKDPFAPPSFAAGKALRDLALNAWDQGGQVTRQDLENAFGQGLPGAAQTYNVGRRLYGDELLQAQRDQEAIRNAAIRWAKSEGKDLNLRRTSGRMSKSEKAPFFEPVKESLLVGDAAEAKKRALGYLATIPDLVEREKAANALIDSVAASQPFRAGPMWSAKNLQEFDAWAKVNLPKSQYERSAKVQNAYVQAAIAAKLMEP